MRRSFRLKIALLSFAVSGALLATFGVVFFACTYNAGIDRMDRELRTLAESSLYGAHPPEHWLDFAKSISFIYGDKSTTHLALRVVDTTGRVVFESANAPAQIAALEIPERPAFLLEFGQRRNDRSFGREGSLTGTSGPSRHGMEFDGPGPGHRRPVKRAEINAVFQTIETEAGNWRVGIFQDPLLSIEIAMDMESFYSDINNFRTAFAITVAIGLCLLGCTGWFLASRAMRPIAVIANTAEGITAKGLGQRISQVGNDQELERLVNVFNGMLDRLEKSYHQAVRFSADAAHELQTPLTILQGELDNAIQSAATGSEEQQRSSMLLEELSNLKSVVQKLLLLAHADEGRLKINRQTVDISELIMNAAEDIGIMAPELQIEMHVPFGMRLDVDPALVNQALRNMATNAAKYTDKNARVIFTLDQTQSVLRFTLANSAVPIPADDRPLLFERFHRVEKSRSAAGSGLGLSLSREIARAHGGELKLNPYADGMVSFTLELPLTQSA